MVGVAVKVTEVPLHIVPVGLAAILTLAGMDATVIVSELDVAGDPVIQAFVGFTVIAQVITSLFTSVLVV